MTVTHPPVGARLPASVCEQHVICSRELGRSPTAYLYIAVLSVALFLTSCSNDPPSPVTLTGPTMGTTYTVKLYVPDNNIDQTKIQSEIDTLLERVNGLMSTWRPDSELSRFNKSKEMDWFPVSAETAHVVSAAEAISTLSDGAFDVTVGPMVNLWGFGPDGGDTGPPSTEQVAATMARIGFRKLEVRASPAALRKQNPDMYVDLSAIAKGYAVDEVARVLDEHDVTSYLVEIGGELRARGSKSDGSPWKVAIERPLQGERSVQSVLELRDTSIATSGDYRNYREKDGKRFSHTIDPRTGRPVDHALASVSVIAPSAMRADALATAIMVLGPEAGYRLVTQEALAAQLIVREDDQFRVLATPQFEAYVLR